MPKAKPYPEDSDEKTTLESQWEEEASTTVEQGDVADRIRSLGEAQRRKENNNNNGSSNNGSSNNGSNNNGSSNNNGHHTGTNSVLEEATVDDQNAAALALSAITPLRVEPTARLMITQGNDTGQTIEVRPGKTYTIGRGIDNDVVLTDIAVSRKHFDLRHEDGAWVIVDRGSGNGTVVNGNIEDNPFMLANGDLIEIGNTVFRYEQENGPVRPQTNANKRSLPLEEDDEEMSTVAGKSLRQDIDSIPDPPRPPRPKTLPPPLPLRPIGGPQPLPLGLPPLAPHPATTLPMPQMGTRPPPIIGPGSPTLLGDQMGLRPQQMMPIATTLTGQPPPALRPSYPYPQATEIPPHSVHAQMLLIQTQNRRGDGSTAHVHPTPYQSDPMMMVPDGVYRQPQLSRRTKLILGAAGLALFAAIATIAIVKSGGPKPVADASSGSAKPETTAVKKNTKTMTTVEPITVPGKVEPTVKVEPKVPTTTVPTPPKLEPKAIVKVEIPKVETPKVEPKKIEPKAIAKVETPKVETPKVEPKKIEPKKVEPKVEPKKVEPKVVKTEKKREVRESEPKEPKKVAAASDGSGARSKADALYRQRKFKEASTLLTSAASNLDEDEAKEMRQTANLYANLGKAYLNGTAPATNPIDAFKYLQQAGNFDRQVGNAFDAEIQTKLAQVAPKAAYKYLGKQEYPAARSAMIVAEKFGADVSIVRQKLESVASELYAEANSLMESNPAQAREKLRLIKSIVDQNSPWFKKANKALGG